MKFGKHNINVMAGMSAYKFGANNFTLSGSGYMDDEVKWNNMNAVQDKETYSAGTSSSTTRKFSVFARVNWNYDSRFYLTGTIRRDGASNFADNHKYATFPSGAFKWNIASQWRHL